MIFVLDCKNFIHENFLHGWLVDEEVSVLGSNDSQNLRRFTKILSLKFTFKVKQHEL